MFRECGLRLGQWKTLAWDHDGLTNISGSKRVLSTFWTPQREVELSLALIVAATSKLASLPVTAKPNPATSPRLDG